MLNTLLSLQFSDCVSSVLLPTKCIDMTTDASLYRWAGIVGETTVHGQFPADLASAHITAKELYAVYATL